MIKVFGFSCMWTVLKLIYHCADPLVNLLLLKCSMTEPVSSLCPCLFFKMGQSRPFLFIFVFSTWHSSNINGKSIDGVLGTRTQGGRMEGTDESTELWRHLLPSVYLILILCTLLSSPVREFVNYFGRWIFSQDVKIRSSCLLLLQSIRHGRSSKRRFIDVTFEQRKRTSGYFIYKMPTNMNFEQHRRTSG